MVTKECSCLKDKYVNLVKSELAPALGCTEPVAVALCAAGASANIDGIPEETTVYVSQYIMKNGMNVGVPNTAPGFRGNDPRGFCPGKGTFGTEKNPCETCRK